MLHVFELARWFKFGRHPDTGNVDINDMNGDVVCNVDEDAAAPFIDAHNASLEKCGEGVSALLADQRKRIDELEAKLSAETADLAPAQEAVNGRLCKHGNHETEACEACADEALGDDKSPVSDE